MKKSAFTLIELLVVIAIIAILASLALPAYTSVMDRAHATQCASNMRQLGLGIQQYLGDHDDLFFNSTPPAGGAAAATEIRWPLLLNPPASAGGTRYVATWKVFRSPFDKRGDTEDSTKAPVSYGINNNVLKGRVGGSKNGAAYASTDLAYPSQLILLAPALQQGAIVTFTGLPTDTGGTPLPLPKPSLKQGTWASRKKIGVLYADFHVDQGLLWSDPKTPSATGPFFVDSTSTSTAGGGERRWVPIPVGN